MARIGSSPQLPRALHLHNRSRPRPRVQHRRDAERIALRGLVRERAEDLLAVPARSWGSAILQYKVSGSAGGVHLNRSGPEVALDPASGRQPGAALRLSVHRAGARRTAACNLHLQLEDDQAGHIRRELGETTIAPGCRTGALEGTMMQMLSQPGPLTATFICGIAGMAALVAQTAPSRPPAPTGTGGVVASVGQQHVTIARAPGRYGGWPANHGACSGQMAR